MELVHATTGETFALPDIVTSLVEPAVQDVVNLITNEYFAQRGEKCLRLLLDNGMVVDDWAKVPAGATLLAITSRITATTTTTSAAGGGGGESALAAHSPRRVIDPPQVMTPSSPLRRLRNSIRGTDNYSLPACRLRAYVDSLFASSTSDDLGAKRSPAVVEEAMTISAISVASAIARNRGKVLLASMHELIEDQKEAERQLREKNNPASRVEEPREEDDDDDNVAMLLLSHIPNELLTQMTDDFGFSFQAAARALLQSRFDLESAVAYVLGSDQEAVAMPFSKTELRTFASWYLADSPKSAPPASMVPTEGGGSSSGGGASRPAEFLQLLEMGFAPSQVRKALRGADGNVADACSALLGDPTALQRIEQRNAELIWLDPIEAAVQAGTISAVGVISCVEKITTNPQAILTLWYERNADFRRLCELFATTSFASANC